MNHSLSLWLWTLKLNSGPGSDLESESQSRSRFPSFSGLGQRMALRAESLIGLLISDFNQQNLAVKFLPLSSFKQTEHIFDLIK